MITDSMLSLKTVSIAFVDDIKIVHISVLIKIGDEAA